MAAVHVYATIGLEEDVFVEESLTLFWEDGGEAACAVDNTVAGKMQLLWYATEPKTYLAGMMRATG